MLALGGSMITALTGQEGGITKLNGKIQWIEDPGLWVVWCVHPAYVLRSKGNVEREEMFEEAIGTFLHCFKLLAKKG